MATETEDKLEHARAQALAKLDSIRAMLARLDHIRECEDPENEDGECEATTDDFAKADLYYLGLDSDEAREKYHDEESAQQDIYDYPLSVETRSGWHTPGEDDDGAAEFRILLCTGGPAVQIRGELDEHGLPARAYIQCQDWFTPWTDVFQEGSGEVLREFSAHFLGF